MRLAATLLLPLATLAQAQTTPASKPAVHRAASTTSASKLPPNIPNVPGIARPLYALRYIDTKAGAGELAPASVLGKSRDDSKVMFYTVRYTGWLAKDGTKFDSSADHPGAEPITFPAGVHQVIPGWDTGFTGMRIGGKRRLFIPYQLAYGEAGRGPIPPKADLIFDIELVSVSDKPPAQPAQPAAQPSGAQPPAPPSSSAQPAKPTTTPDPTKPITDPATNDPAKATTPDNATKPAPKPSTNPPGN